MSVCVEYMTSCIGSLEQASNQVVENCAMTWTSPSGRMAAGYSCLDIVMEELRKVSFPQKSPIVEVISNESASFVKDFEAEGMSISEKSTLLLGGIGIAIVAIVAMRCLCGEKKGNPGLFGSVYL